MTKTTTITTYTLTKDTTTCGACEFRKMVCVGHGEVIGLCEISEEINKKNNLYGIPSFIKHENCPFQNGKKGEKVTIIK